MIKVLLLVPVLLALSYSYCFSDTISGITNNAANNGLSWSMDNVLPTQAGLSINGVLYKYTITKEVDDNTQVTIRNKLKFSDSYLFQEIDDWSSLPGNTITKMVSLPETSRELWGDGEINIQGSGSITNPTVAYNYKYDTCYIILSDPSCPGYAEALYNWLLQNGLFNGEVSINDPYYDEFVQLLLNQEVTSDLYDNTQVVVDKNDSVLEKRLSSNNTLARLGDMVKQAEMLQALQKPILGFDNYYNASIPGGVYNEKTLLEDVIIPDNSDVLRNLAQEALHKDLVNLQYGLP